MSVEFPSVTKTDSPHSIFVDFENIQKIDLDLLAGKSARVFLVFGAGQKRIDRDILVKALKYKDQIQVIEVEQAGRNALDFVLSYYIGRESVISPDARFHILSKDKGYDALVRHLQAKDIFVERHEDFARIPILAGQPAKQAAKTGAVDLVIQRFKRNKNNRPAKKKTLLSRLSSDFPKLSPEKIQDLVEELATRGAITITPEGKVTYDE